MIVADIYKSYSERNTGDDLPAIKTKNCILGEFKMSKKSSIAVPEARQAMEKFKMEAANEVGVNLKDGYNGELTSRQAGSIGGQMVKKMIEDYENKIK